MFTKVVNQDRGRGSSSGSVCRVVYHGDHHLVVGHL